MLSSRMGDTGYGTCPGGDHSHITTGTIITGGCISLIQGSLAARMSDIILSDCSHKTIGLISGGSGTVYIEGLPAARIGDSFNGTFNNGKIISGCGTVIIGG